VPHPPALGLLLAALSAASPAAARDGNLGPDDATVPIQISIRVDDHPYFFGGEGVCQHSAEASIDGAPAALWSARHSEGRRSVSLAFWRLRSGGDMMTLGVDFAAASHAVSTVKVGRQGELQGSGRASFTASGPGGTFSINAIAKDGTRITGTISCGRFTAAPHP
jgi:hypothetical protein